MKLKATLSVIFVVICVLVLGCIFSNLQPKEILENTAYNPVEDTESFSELHIVSDEELFTYAFLNNSDEADILDTFTITIGKLEGILKNRYVLYTSIEINDETLLNPSYFDMVRYPQMEIKDGENYYGSVYTGIAPTDCTKLTIDGQNAILQPYSIDINGKHAEFVVYSCFVEQNEYPESADFAYESSAGEIW